jgi:hypothetical protein
MAKRNEAFKCDGCGHIIEVHPHRGGHGDCAGIL